MEDTKEISILNQNDVENLIYTVRGQRVMLDADLARIYGYETKRLNEQVKRNIRKFPDDFMFQLTCDEVNELWSQNATANINSMSRSNPFVFTEQGVYMLMTVLKGDLAASQSIILIRAFRGMKADAKFHDRYIILDYNMKNEMIYHCGASSKDAGKRITSITLATDNAIYHEMIDTLLRNPVLILS